MTAFTSLDRGSKAPPGNPLPLTPCPCPATSLCPSRCSSRKDSLWIARGERGVCRGAEILGLQPLHGGLGSQARNGGLEPVLGPGVCWAIQGWLGLCCCCPRALVGGQEEAHGASGDGTWAQSGRRSFWEWAGSSRAF